VLRHQATHAVYRAYTCFPSCVTVVPALKLQCDVEPRASAFESFPHAADTCKHIHSDVCLHVSAACGSSVLLCKLGSFMIGILFISVPFKCETLMPDCHLQADICQLGLDQRKVNVLAREYCDQCKPKRKLKPVILSHEMMPGLLQVKLLSSSSSSPIIFSFLYSSLLVLGHIDGSSNGFVCPLYYDAVKLISSETQLLTCHIIDT